MRNSAGCIDTPLGLRSDHFYHEHSRRISASKRTKREHSRNSFEAVCPLENATIGTHRDPQATSTHDCRWTTSKYFLFHAEACMETDRNQDDTNPRCKIPHAKPNSGIQFLSGVTAGSQVDTVPEEMQQPLISSTSVLEKDGRHVSQSSSIDEQNAVVTCVRSSSSSPERDEHGSAIADLEALHKCGLHVTWPLSKSTGVARTSPPGARHHQQQGLRPHSAGNSGAQDEAPDDEHASALRDLYALQQCGMNVIWPTAPKKGGIERKKRSLSDDVLTNQGNKKPCFPTGF